MVVLFSACLGVVDWWSAVRELPGNECNQEEGLFVAKIQIRETQTRRNHSRRMNCDACHGILGDLKLINRRQKFNERAILKAHFTTALLDLLSMRPQCNASVTFVAGQKRLLSFRCKTNSTTTKCNPKWFLKNSFIYNYYCHCLEKKYLTKMYSLNFLHKDTKKRDIANNRERERQKWFKVMRKPY